MNRSLDLSDNWVLTAGHAQADNEQVSAVSSPPSSRTVDEKLNAVAFRIPGDVHSALLRHGIIEDPYYRDNEYAVDWVNKMPWSLSCNFTLDEHHAGSPAVLVLEGIDCVATVFVNDKLIGHTDNQFVRHVFPVSEAIAAGDNQLRIDFAVALDVAARRHRDHPFEIPGESPNCRLPNNNFLRKTACHSGWDWNICLMPVGIHGGVRLERPLRYRMDDVRLIQEFAGDDVTVNVNVQVDVFEACRVVFAVELCAVREQVEVDLYPGQQRISLTVKLSNPALWWPAGLGEQTRHSLAVSLDDQLWQKTIGLCRSQIVTTPDAEGPGSGFRIDINGQAVFMRGANWIPADALPERATPALVRELLVSALDANMNMLRVWGGGTYEADWFYELCDELGILVWQDFMFSCNHYPATDVAWIHSVRIEATQQVRRLSRFACVALWCGDNELVGALTWWEVTQANRDRYLANYVRLNTVLEEAVASEAPHMPWWPSSPSQGLLDYADGWKSDAAGDMHFWDVWHEARPFTAYQEIQPRFCSEFGFQSFPSMPVVNTFANAQDQNVSSRVMGVHQRNVGGNARIVETLVRYFPFPDSFARTVFLSQCQQAMAIRTGVEYWRSLKPHCMGALYWQLNDTWPVASWSSLEYGGGWKLLHYAARRFYKPVTMMVVPLDRSTAGLREYSGADVRDQSTVCLRAVNDSAKARELVYELSAVDMKGQIKHHWQGVCQVDCHGAQDALVLDACDLPDGCFLSFEWFCEDQPEACGDGEYWTRAYKHFQLPVPQITIDTSGLDNSTAQLVNDGGEHQPAPFITLTTDKPAFFVSVELGGNRVWSDNGFTLLPGKPKKISALRTLAHPAIPMIEPLNLEHL